MTVIDARFHRSSARNARMVFALTALIVGVLTAVIAADRMHPILALFVGVLVAVPTGAVVWAVVRVWPLIRLVWWWLPEIVIVCGLVYGWMQLVWHTTTPVRLVTVAVLLGVPAVVGPIRRRLVSWAWCLIVRHRLRTSFAQFIVANKSGSLPLILLARPTPVGERVWIYLRPGLSLSDLTSRLEKLTVACHADAVMVERASSRTAALLRIDVKRRQVLTKNVDSPLVDLVDPNAPVASPLGEVLPTALDLPDVASTKPAPVPAARESSNGRKATPAAAAASPAGADVDDVNQWI